MSSIACSPPVYAFVAALTQDKPFGVRVIRFFRAQLSLFLRPHPVYPELLDSGRNIMSHHLPGAGPSRSFVGTLAAVAWSFIGLRRKSDFDRDVTALNPVYVLLAGLVGVGLFIGVLLSVVAYVTH